MRCFIRWLYKKGDRPQAPHQMKQFTEWKKLCRLPVGGHASFGEWHPFHLVRFHSVELQLYEGDGFISDEDKEDIVLFLDEPERMPLKNTLWLSRSTPMIRSRAASSRSGTTTASLTRFQRHGGTRRVSLWSSGSTSGWSVPQRNTSLNSNRFWPPFSPILTSKGGSIQRWR